jgi:hypothetical protein
LVPASDGSNDGVRVLSPMEGLWLGIGLGDEAVDGFLERGQGVEDAALQAPFGEPGEEPLDCIDPGCRGRREVEGPVRMAAEPLDELGVLVGGVVVDDSVHQLADRHLGPRRR